MNKHWQTLAVIAAVILLACGIYLLFADSPSEKGNASSKQSDNAVAEFSNSTMKEDKDGKPVWRLTAEHVSISQDKNTARLTGITGYFQNDEIKLSLKAKEGVLDRAKKTVRLEGTIEASTADGAVLHAENLTYDGNKDILSTDKAFTAERDGKILTADSFTADRVLQEIRAKGHARLRDKEE